MDIITSRPERLELEIYEAEKEKLQREETLGDFWEHMPAIDPILIRDRMLSLQNQISSLESKKKALFKEQQHLLVQAVTLGSSSRSSSKRTYFNGGLFNDNGAMGSRCHSLTLGKPYAWEKKLSEEAGEETITIYERKHSQSRHGLKTGDKIGVEDEELRSRILVAIRNSE
ncbi:hypothetical protein GBA52_017100 [Prunus armeniaca]|nr:hypothetical protein GBA52_017100 [Prunus armeniaca]